MRVLLLPLVMGLLVGCLSLDEKWQRWGEAHRETLDQMYPPGEARDSIRAKFGDLQPSSMIREEMDRFLAYCLTKVEEPVSACDTHMVFRGSSVSLPVGVPGLYLDYVLYGPDGHVVRAYRRFLD